jgi:hypothetical protein
MTGSAAFVGVCPSMFQRGLLTGCVSFHHENGSWLLGERSSCSPVAGRFCWRLLALRL